MRSLRYSNRIEFAPNVVFVAGLISQIVLGVSALVTLGVVAATGTRILDQVNLGPPLIREAIVMAAPLGIGLTLIVLPLCFKSVSEADLLSSRI